MIWDLTYHTRNMLSVYDRVVNLRSGLKTPLCALLRALDVSVLCCLLMLLFPVAGLLQAQVGANVEGTVTDKSGAVVPGATVTITNTSTGISQTVTTGQ